MQENVFKWASKVKKPLTLASVIAIALYFIYKIILGMDIFAPLGENNTFTLVTSIADKIFYLSLISLVFGIVSFSLLSYFNAQRSRQQREWIVTGHVFLSNGKPLKGALVFVEGVDRSKETDANGWFSIVVNEQESWIVHASYNEQYTETEIARENINKPIRLTISIQESDSLPPALPPVESPSSSKVIELLKDPVPSLRLIKTHLSQQPAERDYSEPIIAALSPICENDSEVAKLIFQQLIHEQYLNSLVGGRYELSLKAHDILIKRRP
jgi:hypothetical protein